MVPNCATAEDLLKTIKDKKVQMIDLRFTDLPGVWQHFSVPSAVNVDALNEGIGFDGSSIRGFQEIQESDMLVVPDPTTAFVDPFTTATTLVLICNIRDPVTGQSYSRDARYIAQKAETYLKSTGLAEQLFRSGGGVLRLQRRALRAGHQLCLPRNRFERGQLEHRHKGGAEWPQAAPEGSIFPGSPGRQHAGSPHRDGADDGVTGNCDRGPSP